MACTTWPFRKLSNTPHTHTHPPRHPPTPSLQSKYGIRIWYWFPQEKKQIDLLCRRKTSMVHQTFVQWASYSLFKFVKSHQTFGLSHRKCLTCPMIFVNTGFRDLIAAAPLNCQRSVRYPWSYTEVCWELNRHTHKKTDRQTALAMIIPGPWLNKTLAN